MVVAGAKYKSMSAPKLLFKFEAMLKNYSPRWSGSQVAAMRAPLNQLRYPLLAQRGNPRIPILVNQLTSSKEHQHLVNWKDLHLHLLIHQHQKKKTDLPPLFYQHWLLIHWDLRFHSSGTHALLLLHVQLTFILLVYHLVKKKLTMQHQIHPEKRKKKLSHRSKCLVHPWRNFCPRNLSWVQKTLYLLKVMRPKKHLPPL